MGGASAERRSACPERRGARLSPRFPTDQPTRALPVPIEGNNLQDRIETALAALRKRAAGRGNTIEPASLAPADLFFLADLPLSFSTGMFFERRITVADARRIDQILDQAAGTGPQVPPAFLGVSAIARRGSRERATPKVVG